MVVITKPADGDPNWGAVLNAVLDALNAGKADLAGDTFTGLVNLASGANIASAATVDLTAATGNSVTITGTTATSAFTMNDGQHMTLVAAAAWPLTYHATNCKIIGGASYTCKADQRVELLKTGGVVYVFPYGLVPTATTGSDAVPRDQLNTLMAAQATTSGTFKDFTVPSWVNEIHVLVASFSSNGTSLPQVQLGDSGGIENTGYAGSVCTIQNAASTTTAAFSSGFIITALFSAPAVITARMTIRRVSGNLWMADSSSGFESSAITCTSTGSKTLSGDITTVRFTTVNGTDVGDLGSVSVMYS